MTKKELVEKYPKIFSIEEVDPRYPFPMFGIECGEGWVGLLDKLCHHLQFNTDNNNSYSNEGTHPQIHVTQVKEKYGGLRFYVNGASIEDYAIISFAESLSYGICEDCGKFKQDGDFTMDYEGWIYTLCNDCKGKMIKKRKSHSTIYYLLSYKTTWWFRKYLIRSLWKQIKKKLT